MRCDDRGAAHDILTRAGEFDLFARLRAGDRAAGDRIAECNMGLVRRLAGRYARRHLDWPRLMSAGRYGLAIAIRKFDHTQDVKFSTYLAYWVKQAIQRDIQLDRPIHVPVHACEDIVRSRRTGEPPSPSALAGMAVMRFAGPAPDARSDFVDLLSDDRPAAESARREAAEQVRWILDRLEPAERLVLSLRADGLDFRTIGLRLGCNKDTAIRRHNRAIRVARAVAEGRPAGAARAPDPSDRGPSRSAVA